MWTLRRESSPGAQPCWHESPLLATMGTLHMAQGRSKRMKRVERRHYGLDQDGPLFQASYGMAQKQETRMWLL